MRHALNTLAAAAPEWLRAGSPADWRERYARRAEDDRRPTTPVAWAALALTIGHDGWRVLSAIDDPEAPPGLREVPAIIMLRRAWMHNYGSDGTQLRWRETGNIPPAAQFIRFPYDADAHSARKYTTQWAGYKVHLTETCEDDLPPLITHLETTSGPVADGAAPPTIHAALQHRDRLPATHIVDTGFLDAALFVESRDAYGVDLLGPTRLDDHWQAREGAGFDVQHFPINGDQQQATCAVGKTSISWTPAVDSRGHAVITVKFSRKDGRRCDHLAQYVRSKKRYPRRTLTIRPQPYDQALQSARHWEVTDAFQAEYARRAGIEGTISHGVRTAGRRRTRDIGLTRVRLGHVLTAVGLNVLRLGEGFRETARAKTRVTPFARLMADASAA